jgi:ABC-type Fe3+ transport system permease subunit
LTAALWLLVGVCAVPPVAWIGWQLGALMFREGVLVLLPMDLAEWWLLGRTVLYAAMAAAVAVVLGLWPGVLMARGRGVVAAGVVVCAAVSLMLPSIVHTYGWSQLLRLLGYTPAAGSVADIGRCIWTLGCWLWGIVAVLVGITLRRMDSDVEAAARLDGGHWRVVLGSLRGTLATAAAMVMLLAAAEFAVYEPTGIRVVATEARTVYDTGLRSGQRSALGGGGMLASQSDRAALAIATVAPLSAMLMGGLAVAIGVMRRGAWEVTGSSAGPWVGGGRGRGVVIACAAAVVVTTLVLPLVGLVLSLSSIGALGPWRVLEVFWPQFVGTLSIGLVVGLAAVVIGLLVAMTSGWAARVPAVGSLAVFALGGLVLGIAQVSVWAGLDAVGDSWVVVVMTHVARLAWLPLLAAAWLHTPGWQNLRDAARADGATAYQLAWTILLPVGWPIIAAAGLATGLLAMTEVPANLILSPQNPPMLTPMMMTWVHMLRYDDMLVASLLLAGLTVVLGGVATAVLWVAVSGRRSEKSPRA